MTAPTSDRPEILEPVTPSRRRSRFYKFSRPKPPSESIMLQPAARSSGEGFKDKVEKRKSKIGSLRPGRDPLEDLRKLATSRGSGERLSTDGQKTSSRSQLNLPLPRQSESSRSEGDLLDNVKAIASNGSPEKSNASKSHTTFSWMTRRNKNRNSLFPLPARVTPSNDNKDSSRPMTPRASTGARSSTSPDQSPSNSTILRDPVQSSTANTSEDIPRSIASTAASSTVVNFALPSTLLRASSVHSGRSSRSSPAVILDPNRRGRMRSSTLGSSGGLSDDISPPTPPFAAGGVSGRNSTSTAGRSSFSNLFALNRLRHGSEPHSPRQGSPGFGLSANPALDSHTNSLNLSRETIALPEREDGQTALHYLTRVEEAMPKSMIPSMLSKSDDEFLHNVMRSFMRKFAFFGDPLDMAVRKLLLEIDLPKETQQIDRVLQGFSDRYHECNPGIFSLAGTYMAFVNRSQAALISCR